MKIYLSIILILLSYSTTNSFAVIGVTEGYQKLQQVRRQAGMVWFKTNPELQAGAQGHADYLSNNNITGHIQSNDPQFVGFTGVTAPDRATNAGYLSRIVSENVSAGQNDIFGSIDSLMSAIYHRFAFLNAEYDEVGIGFKVNNNNPPRANYVYNMGNHLLKAACVTEEPITGAFFNNICKDSTRITQTTYDAALNRLKARNPEVIVWPADGANDIPPAFFEESPDPLPDFSVSGYPISIEFNDFYVNNLVLNSFKLFNSQGIEITNTRLLTKSTDPAQRLSDKQFALFPLQRLDWNSLYQVVVEYQNNGQTKTKQWSFKTRSPKNAHLFTLTSDGQVFNVGSNSIFAVYIPPSNATDGSLGVINSSFSGGSQLNIDFADGNTLLLSYRGNLNHQANLSTGNGHNFSIRIVNQAPFTTTQVRPPLGSCYVNGIQAQLVDNIVKIPHLLVDGQRFYDIEITLISGTNPALFNLTDVTDAEKQDISCRSGSYSFTTNELHLPDVNLPNIGKFDAELGFINNFLELKALSKNP